MPDILLSARNLVKSYSLRSHNDTPVLRGVSLEVARGEFLALMGPSGAGKSTLLHLLGLLDAPNSGYTEFDIDKQIYDSRSLTSKSADFVRNKHIGFIFQFHHLLPEFTVLENVMTPALIAGLPVSEAKSRAKELLESTGLSHRAEHKPAEISGGEQQRAAIARALINEPALIIADEPTGNLDSANAAAILGIIAQLRDRRDLTFIVATHSTEVAALANRVVMMRDGMI
ncbi:lipoprotein-releasing ABC transporter ATP-binding protein LolD [Ignavibacteria bacterium]|nr:ABC transporter ATP-binding protein [Bacteroidota bacterium]MCZ2133750.1 ABC transporter ATP-binding protein [Bacteroidota bacterium]